MSVRVESIVLYPDAFFLPFAVLFFLLLSYRGIRPKLPGSCWRTWGVLSACLAGGALGGMAYGWIGPSSHTGLPENARAWSSLRFGSFGGHWGVLIGAALCGALIRDGGLWMADAVVPGLIAGAAISRLSCLFAGCCQGITLGEGWFQPFKPWPAYDIAALLATGAAIRLARRGTALFGQPGTTLALYLGGYGILRFLIEFVRDAPAWLVGLSCGQAMAAAQCCVGGAMLLWALRPARQGAGEASQVCGAGDPPR